MKAVVLDLDAVLADTRPLWRAWLESVGGVLGVDVHALPEDRGAAARRLDELGAGNWRDLLERFAEERVPLHVRRDPAIGDAVRALASGGAAIGVFTDAPEPLARVVVRHLGVDRRLGALETGSGALERVAARLGSETVVLRTREELLAATATA